MNLKTLKAMSDANQVDAFLAAIGDANDCCKFHRLAIGAGAIPATTQMFNVPAAPGVCNLEKQSVFSYPTAIDSIACELYSTAATALLDKLILLHTCELAIYKDSKEYRSIPLSSLSSGSGNNAFVSGPAAAGQISTTSLGLDGRPYLLLEQMIFAPDQPIRVEIKTSPAAFPGALGTLTGAVRIIIGLMGKENRRLV